MFGSDASPDAEATDVHGEPLVGVDDDEELQEEAAIIAERSPSASRTPLDVERTCTDWWCLLIALAVSIGAICFGQYLHSNANLSVLRHGYGYQRLVCPSKVNPFALRPPKERTYAFWCVNATRTGLLLSEPLCVDKCPTSDYTYHKCEGGLVRRQDYSSVSVGFYCMPLASNLRKQVKDAFSSRRGEFLRLFSVLTREWFLFALATGIAIIIGYLYMILLFFDAKTVVNATLTLITFLPLGSGIYLLISALSPVDGSALDIYAYVDNETPEEEQTKKIIAGSLLTLTGVVIWCLASSTRDAISMSAECMEACGDCMTEEWSILIAPLVAILLEVAILISAFYFASCVAARVQERSVRNELQSEEDFAGFKKDTARLHFRSQEIAELLFVVLFSYWLNEVVVAASQAVMALVTEDWYFTQPSSDGTRERECGILIKAYAKVLVYHLGTSCLGAALKAFGRFPAYVIGYLRYRGIVRQGYLDKFFYVVLGEGVTFAYVDLGLRSESYMEGAFRADQVIKGQISNVRTLLGALRVFNLAGIGLTTAGTAYLVDLMIRLVPSFTDPSSNLYIVETNGVFVINAVIGLIIGRNIMVGFDIVFDTIIYCYAIELERKQEESIREETRLRENNHLLWFIPPDSDKESDPDENNFLPARMKDAYSTMTGNVS